MVVSFAVQKLLSLTRSHFSILSFVLLPFQFGYLLIFSHLIPLARTSNTILNSSNESEWASLSCSWSSGKCFQSFIIEYEVSFGFSTGALYHCKESPLLFLECYVFLSWKGIQLSNAFLYQLRWPWGCFFHFVPLMWCTTLIDFHIEPRLHS